MSEDLAGNAGFASPLAHFEAMSPEEKAVLQRQTDLYNILNKIAMSADGHAGDFKPMEPLNMLEARAVAGETVQDLLHNPAFAMGEAMRVCIHMVEYELKVASTPSLELLRSHLEVGMLLVNAINDDHLKNPPKPPNPITVVPSLEAAGIDEE